MKTRSKQNIVKVILSLLILITFFNCHRHAPKKKEQRVAYSWSFIVCGKFVVSIAEECQVYNTTDTTDPVGTIEANILCDLEEIKGNDEWVKIRHEKTAGWIQASKVRIDLKTICEGYRLFPYLKVSSIEFANTTGETLKYVISPQKKSGFVYEGCYLKEVFSTLREAAVLGDSFAKEGLLKSHPATGAYYEIFPIFKATYPHLYLELVGSMDNRVFSCPIRNDTLWAPGKYLNCFSKGGEGIEILQCVKGHLVAVWKIYLD